MVKELKVLPPQDAGVRTRRAYFDCRFGQLHVQTAFPTTGGFDEGIPLFCLHSDTGTSRMFAALLPLVASDRSAYAPDLPGWGESDGAPGLEQSAAAVADLAADLRLRQIDVLGVGFGAGVARELAAAHTMLVRRLVLIATLPRDAPVLKHTSLVMPIDDYPADLLDSPPEILAQRISDFLKAAP